MRMEKHMPTELPGFIQQAPEGVFITVHVQPRAKQSALAGTYGESALRVRIAEPPVDDKANTAVVKFIAKLCGIPPSRVELVGGAHSRTKRLLIKGITAEQAASALRG